MWTTGKDSRQHLERFGFVKTIIQTLQLKNNRAIYQYIKTTYSEKLLIY